MSTVVQALAILVNAMPESLFLALRARSYSVVRIKRRSCFIHETPQAQSSFSLPAPAYRCRNVVGEVIFCSARLMSRASPRPFPHRASTIRRLAESFAGRRRPTLIRDLWGLRQQPQWSVFMTVEHLVIVDESVISILET